MSTGPSLYRRHRPRTFDDVVGQEHVVRTLRNAVEQGQVHHAYLFVGSRGTGKTSMAKILAACLNCEQGPTVSPCGICESCVAIHNATSLDVIEMDAASNNSVDDIRDLREKVAFAPVSGRHKVYILDEAHMLSPQAWNAFLKTLEEPPSRTIFVLATTEAQKVLPTVVDRCHRFDFGRPSVEQVATVLGRVAQQEAIDIDGAAVALIARHATGSFRDALGTLEQLVTYAGGRQIATADVLAVLGVADAEQLFTALEAVHGRDPAGALRVAARLAEQGRDPGQILRDLEVHARELLTVQVLGEVPPELRVTPERDRRLLEQAEQLGRTDTVRMLDLVSAALEATANGAQPRIQLELVLIKAAAPEVDPATTALMSRIERLEAALGGTEPRTADERPKPPPAPPERTAPPPTPSERTNHAPPISDRVIPAAPQQVAAAAVAVAEAPVQVLATETAPVGAASLDLDAAARAWPAVIDLVRDQNAMLAALLTGARPVGLADGHLTVAFPADAAFLKRKAEQDDHRRVAAAAFRSVTGQALGLRYELMPEEEITEAAVAPAGAPAPGDAATAATQVVAGGDQLSADELVKRFLEEFNAEELLDDEPDEREGD